MTKNRKMSSRTNSRAAGRVLAIITAPTNRVKRGWTKVAGAAGYRVLVKADEGRRQLLLAPRKATRLTVPEVTSDDKLQLTVSAVDTRGRQGKSRAATSRPPKAKKKSKKK